MERLDKNTTYIFSDQRELNIDQTKAMCRVAMAETYGVRMLRISDQDGKLVVAIRLEPAFTKQIEAVKQGMIGGNEIIADIVDVEASKQNVHIYKDSRLELARFLVSAVQHEMQQEPKGRTV